MNLKTAPCSSALWPSLIFSALLPYSSAEEAGTTAISKFADQIGKLEFKEVEAPSDLPVFRWDFSKRDVEYSFNYTQRVSSTTDFGATKGGPRDQDMTSEGLLLVKSKGDGTADIVLKDMEMTIGAGGANPMTQKMPPSVMQGMKEDSTGISGSGSVDSLLKILFPLPPKDLKVGETVAIPAEMPFNAMGSRLMVTGESKMTLTRFVDIEDRVCARFDVVTEISKLDVPDELEGTYKCSTSGTSVLYFDIGERTVVSGEVALITHFKIDAPMPGFPDGEERPAHIPKRTSMSMGSDNLIKIELEGLDSASQ